MSNSMEPRGADWADAALWAIVPAVVLSVVGIGEVSGDAVMHANRYEQDTWFVNPNHLLMEPIAALWYALGGHLDIGATGPDRLKVLSIVSGGLSVGLFRGGLIAAISDDRLRKNAATALFAGGYAFLALWISGEPHMLQMPALVLAGWATIRYLRTPEPTVAIWMGLAFGAAVLFYVSNVVLALATIAAAVASCHLVSSRRSMVTDCMVAVLALGCTVGVGAAVLWQASGAETGLLDWMLRYSGGRSDGIVNEIYGLDSIEPAVLATAVARSLYGAGLAIVDVSPTVDALRGFPSLAQWVTIGAPLALLIAMVLLGWTAYRMVGADDTRYRRCAVAIGAWTFGVLLFGAYFNISDDQFYFQLAVPLAAAVGGTPWGKGRSRAVACCMAAVVVLWNVTYVSATKIAYPRDARMNELESDVTGAGLVIHPGNDEAGRLLYLLPDSLYRQRLTVVELAGDHSPNRGLAILADSIQKVRASDSEVRVISIHRAHPDEHPWSFLREVGYSSQRVGEVLRTFPAEPVGEERGTFDTWRIIPSPE